MINHRVVKRVRIVVFDESKRHSAVRQGNGKWNLPHIDKLPMEKVRNEGSDLRQSNRLFHENVNEFVAAIAHRPRRRLLANAVESEPLENSHAADLFDRV